MRSLKSIIFTFLLAFLLQSPVALSQALSADTTEEFDSAREQLSVPSDDRINTDLINHYSLGSAITWDAGSINFDLIESSSIRTAVRKDELLEIRVTSFGRQGEQNDGDQFEVDSLMTYERQNGHWALQAVKTEHSRKLTNQEHNC